MSLPRKIYGAWRDIMDNKSDPRTTDWFMMSSPLPTIALSLTYLYCVKIIGPRLMANRKPVAAGKKIQLWYNIIHLAINVYLFHEACVSGWMAGYSYRCQSVDFALTGTPLRIARGCWIYYLSKFTDFFETFTFIMLKRFDMVNLYHIAHHSIMPVSVWWGVKFLAGGHSTFFGFINTAVHIVIYTYLVTITVFPATRKYFGWWKTFYPFFQIGQFGLIFLHALQLLWNNDCNFPMVFVYFISGHALLFYLLVTSKMRMDKAAKLLEEETKVSDYESDKKSEFSQLEGVEESYKTIRQRAKAEASR